MTFEEYLEHARSFCGPLFNPGDEKAMKFYKESYQQHLLKIEDDEYFEPVDVMDNEMSLSRYNDALEHLMGIDKFLANEISFLIVPSFDAESLARLIRQGDSYILELITLSSSFWKAFTYDNNPHTVKRISYSTVLSGSSGAKLWSILSYVVNTARKPRVRMITLDGVGYKLNMVINNEFVQVEKRSPVPQSFPGKVVELMEQLADCVVNKSESEMEKIINSAMIPDQGLQ